MKPQTRTGRNGGGESFFLRPFRWIAQVFGKGEIHRRVQENFPNWQEFSEQKLREGEERGRGAVELPPHKVFISSPLQWNFLFFLLVAAMLAMGYANPDWAVYFIYGAIGIIFLGAVFFIVRDGVFFHLEGQRLEDDCAMINRSSDGPEIEETPDQPGGLLKRFARKKKKTIFRSNLLQIHYQNVLRTFEQGNRKAQVNQDSSIADIHTLLTQRGMKLVWTAIEILPQLGLLGTLVGLARMFLAFNINDDLPEVSVIAGFGTALGTTILANLFVLILRPLFMRNDRAMHEILSTLQMLMATFILPTQHYVLGGRASLKFQGLAAPATLPGEAVQDHRLARSMDQLSSTLTGLARSRKGLESGGLNPEALQIAQEAKSRLDAARGKGDAIHVNFPTQALAKLTDSMQTLSRKLESSFGRERGGKAGSGQKIEHDLLQLRMLNHDTLALLERVAKQLDGEAPGGRPLLSRNKRLRNQAFSETGAEGDALAELSGEGEGGGAGKGPRPRPTRSRLFRGRR